MFLFETMLSFAKLRQIPVICADTGNGTVGGNVRQAGFCKGTASDGVRDIDRAVRLRQKELHRKPL